MIYGFIDELPSDFDFEVPLFAEESGLSQDLKVIISRDRSRGQNRESVGYF